MKGDRAMMMNKVTCDLEEFRYQRKLRAMEDVKEFRMVDVLTVYLQQIKS